MEQFSLEKYLENPSRKVVTRDGREVEILKTDFRGYKQIIGVIKNCDNKDDEVEQWDGQGNFRGLFGESKYDLFFADEEEKLTEFEQELRYWIGQSLCNYENNGCVLDNMSDSVNIYLKTASKKLLDLARKEIEKENSEFKPKFKVGDWVICCDYEPIQIIDIKHRMYYWSNGDIRPIEMVDSNSNIHLWTIEDAKDGDVLAEHETVVLFKKIEDQNIRCYCTYHYLGFNPTFYVGTLQNKDPYYPATEEQRDLLLQKMKEIGYEWDAEKKELRTIENTSNMTEALRTEYERGRTDAIAEMKTIEWSVEDEANMDAVWKACGHVYGTKYQSILGDWLKSLKDRVQPHPKQEWSEEDKEMLNRLIGVLEGTNKEDCHEAWEEKFLPWLKSLKPQNHWKPSEEQLEALWDIIPHIPNSERDIDTITELSALYEELKKL